jgi:hypothetical protein
MWWPKTPSSWWLPGGRRFTPPGCSNWQSWLLASVPSRRQAAQLLSTELCRECRHHYADAAQSPGHLERVLAGPVHLCLLGSIVKARVCRPQIRCPRRHNSLDTRPEEAGW